MSRNIINPSNDYIEYICKLYGDRYDDREEDSKPKGLDWAPGKRASHRSLTAFQKELEEDYGIRLSTSKIRKILITGNCWTTERSRRVQELFETYTESKGMENDTAIRKIAERLRVSIPTVCMKLPYKKVVYNMELKSSNARRCDKWREKRGRLERRGHT